MERNKVKRNILNSTKPNISSNWADNSFYKKNFHSAATAYLCAATAYLRAATAYLCAATAYLGAATAYLGAATAYLW